MTRTKRTTTLIFENMPLDRVAQEVGVHVNTVRRWLREKDDNVVRIRCGAPEPEQKKGPKKKEPPASA